MSRPKSTLIKAAVIIGAHGIRGQVKIRSLLPYPEEIEELDVFTDAMSKKSYAIKIVSNKVPQYIVAIEGIKDRNAAEALKNIVLYTNAENISEPEHSQLIGKTVKTSDGDVYGVISSVVNYGAGDIIEIQKSTDSEMLPLNEQFIKISGEEIMVIPPNYLEAEKK
jgi:16S rRNA processing protein RimM